MASWRDNIRQVEPYVPGEQPKNTNVIKLNTNENPYGPSPRVKAVQDNEDLLRLYPDPTAGALVDALAEINRFCSRISHILFMMYGQNCSGFHISRCHLMRTSV